MGLLTDFHRYLKSTRVNQWVEFLVRLHLFPQTFIVQDQISFKNVQETSLFMYERINKGDHGVSAQF